MKYDWKNSLIKPESLLRDALLILEREPLRATLVVDDKCRLLGIVTDGDIRRGLIQDFHMDSPVKDVMNREPLTAPIGTARNEVVKMMESNQFVCIPILKGKVVVGLETLQTPGELSTHDNPVFIMAGGFGKRLRPLTENCPKPMLKLGGKPVLEILLTKFIASGFKNFYISTHYLPEVIQDYFGDGSAWNVKITYVHEMSPLGTGGALGLLPDNIPDLPLVLINGDVLTNLDFEKVLQFHNKNKAAATMCVKNHEYQVPFGVINIDDNKVVSMIEKPTHRFMINAGVYIVGQNIIRAVEKNIPIDMPALLERHIAIGEDVLTFPIHEYWLDIGRLDDYARAQSDILTIG